MIFVDTDSYCVQVLQLVLPLVLQEERGPVQECLGWPALPPPVPTKSDQKPEIQPHHLPPGPPLQSVQVFPQFILPDNGLQSVHSSAEDRLPLHLLVPAGLRLVGDDHPGGD